MSTEVQFPPIQIFPLGHPILRVKCTPVEDIPSLKGVFEKMRDYCTFCSPENADEVKAAGLAAPQIGITERFFLFLNDKKFEAVANPELLETRGIEKAFYEGCESIPGFRGTVMRPEEIRVRYVDGFTGDPVETWLHGFAARVFQHELDHIDGVLITDRCSANDLRRGGAALKRMEKYAKRFIRNEN